MRRLARMGYAAKGVVYVIVGGIAMQAALGLERPADSGGALRAIQEEPYGRFALTAVALGLAGYVLWRLVQAALDPERRGTDAEGIATRAGFVVSALLHAALVVEAVRMLRGGGGGAQGDQQADHWTATAMEQPLGRWLVGLAGAAVVAFGIFELFRGARGDITRRLDLSELRHQARRGLVLFGRTGLIARGVVFAVIGWFLVRAALQYDPQEATGLAGALSALQGRPLGSLLLGAVAVGLIAYGLWQLTQARYRRIDPL